MEGRAEGRDDAAKVVCVTRFEREAIAMAETWR